jgi:hypothetical protein
LVLRLLRLDDDEAAAMQKLAGGEAAPLRRDPAAFCHTLQRAMLQLRLSRLFVRRQEGLDHRGICPAAYDPDTGAHDAQQMAQWRADFRAMAPERQMMAATIVWLYQAGPDSTWLRRVPCTWQADEALHYMRDAGCLALWLQLVARCPGW